MKLHVLNDLHVEFCAFNPPSVDADVVVLAGDIGVGRGGLGWTEQCFPDRPVVYVPGNHEYYDHDLDLLQTLRGSAPHNVHVLDNHAVTLDGVRFLGCTLWTDFLLYGLKEQYLAMQSARDGMADFSQIHNNGRRFTPRHAVRLHMESRYWLAQKLHQPFDGVTVVVTHHAPSPRSIHPRYEGHPLNPAFASDLESLMGGERAGLWIHGHMHDALDYRVNGTRVLCNPRGYAPDELAEGFRADLVVEV